MIGDPVCVAPTGDVCGEGVVWHAAHNALYWCDINRFLVHRLSLADSSVRSWMFEEPVTALCLTDRDDVMAVVLGSSVILWEPGRDLRHDALFCLNGWPSVRLNDARPDPRGSLWAGSMRNNVRPDGSSGGVGGQDGILVRIDPNGRATCFRDLRRIHSAPRSRTPRNTTMPMNSRYSKPFTVTPKIPSAIATITSSRRKASIRSSAHQGR